MRPRAGFVASASVVTAIVLAGCGSSSGSSGGGSATSSTTGAAQSSTAGKKIDVCSIITPADAQKVIGGPVEVQAPAGSEGLTSGVCLYRATGSGIRVSLLQARVYPGPQFYGENAIPGAKSIELSGTDKAFVRRGAGGKTVDVQFVKDGKTGAINFTDTGTTPSNATVANVQAVAQTLADAI